MLTGKGWSEEAAQRLSSAPFGTHRRTERVNLAASADQPGLAALVTGTQPGFTAGLARQGTDCAFVLEAVTILVGALAAYVIAIQARAAWAASNGELCGAP